MNRRRLLGVAVAVVLGALALWVAVDEGLLPWPWSPESRARAVRVGMSMAEVEAVMGRPPNLTAEWADPTARGRSPDCWRYYWYSDRGNVAVTFSPDGRVEEPAIFMPPLSARR